MIIKLRKRLSFSEPAMHYQGQEWTKFRNALLSMKQALIDQVDLLNAPDTVRKLKYHQSSSQR